MAAAMLVNTACYSFVPLSADIVPVAGDHVRVRLTPEGTAALTGQLGPSVQWAEGTLSERRSDGTIVVGVGQVRLLDGLDHFWTGQGVVAMSPSHVAEVQRRTLDKGRSRVAAVMMSLALLGVAAVALGVGGAHGSPDTGTIPPPP
jgi:hypothetical protein